MDLPLEFPYYPRIRTLALVVVGFAFGGTFFEHLGETNTQGLIVHGIELSPENATRAYYVIAALAGIFVVLGVLGILELAFSSEKPILRLTADEIILPPFLPRGTAYSLPGYHRPVMEARPDPENPHHPPRRPQTGGYQQRVV